MPAIRPGDRYRKPEAKCASTFCRSGDSTTATANLHTATLIQQQLAAYVKSIAPVALDPSRPLPQNADSCNSACRCGVIYVVATTHHKYYSQLSIVLVKVTISTANHFLIPS